jgi:hypothetical protein
MKGWEKVMSELEKQSFEEFVKAMSEEEMKIAVSKINTDMLWDELRKRSTANRNILHGVKDLVMGK